MNPVKVLNLILNEARPNQVRQRTPEPQLVMDQTEQVDAFSSGGEDALHPLYLLHLEKMSKALEPGMRVLDLGCGSGQLLTLAASMFPEVEFIGRDLSSQMLEQARKIAKERNTPNVLWQIGDISDLSDFSGSTLDGVVSSLAFHHLPSIGKFCETIAEINRVVRPSGAVVISDLGFLKSDASIRILVEDRREIDHPILIRDYEDSLRAAFSLEDWRQGVAQIGRSEVVLYHTRWIRFFFQAQSRLKKQYPGSKKKLDLFRSGLSREALWNYRMLKFLETRN